MCHAEVMLKLPAEGGEILAVNSAECFSILKKKKKTSGAFFRVTEKASECKSFLQTKIHGSGAEGETEGEKTIAVDAT